MAYLPYISSDRQTVLGHYSVAQRSGEIAATLGAAGHLASVRWAPSINAYFVLLRLRVGYSVSADITSGKIETAFRAIRVTGFTVDFTTASTAISMVNSNKMRTSMGNSLMGTVGPRICTTAVQSGQTLTADNAPFGIATVGAGLLQNVNATGTAVLAVQGTQGPMTTLYERTTDGQHPLVLSANEGIVVQNVLAGPASGTFALYAVWDWAEVLVF